MSAKRSYKIKKRDFIRSKRSIIQHKLRTLIRCYTIREFDLDEENKTYTFKKSYKKNGIKIDSDKALSGRYEAEEDDKEGKYITLKLFLD